MHSLLFYIYSTSATHETESYSNIYFSCVVERILSIFFLAFMFYNSVCIFKILTNLPNAFSIFQFLSIVISLRWRHTYSPIQKIHRTYKGILWNWKMSRMTRHYFCSFSFNISECCGFWNNIEPSLRKNNTETERWLWYFGTWNTHLCLIVIHTCMLKTFKKSNSICVGHPMLHLADRF